MGRHTRSVGRAFALVELVVVVGVVGAACVLMMVGSVDARRRARLSGSVENLRLYATGMSAYGADSADRVATFSWRAGVNYGFGGVAPSDMQAAANQAIDIIRRRAGRTELQPLSSWVPHLLYNHLVLVDYLGQELPARWAVSPGDVTRIAWQRDPRNFASLNPQSRPFSVGDGSQAARWPYSSSYEMPPAFYSPDQASGSVQTISQASTHNTYIVPANPTMGTRVMSEVLYPSHKAMMYETVQRFFGPRQAYFAYEEARVPVLMADGSVGVRGTESCNRGFQPNTPTSPSPTSFNYQPDLGYEPATLSGAAQDVVFGHMRWTRRGLLGRDFGAAQVP
jgi:hypothetical protein